MTLSRCALGFRVKSGFAVAVALAGPSTAPVPLGRFVVALSDPRVEETRQPFHDGFGTAQEDRAAIARLVKIIERCAARSIDELLDDERLGGRTCKGAALVVGSVIDPSTVGNPHIRAHAQEGRLFRTVLEDALRPRKIGSLVIVEKTLAAEAPKTLRRSDGDIKRTIAGMGRTLGGPWRAEEKAAATAAWIALAHV